MSDIIEQLRTTAEQIRQIEVPDELTVKSVDSFKDILKIVDGLCFELLDFRNDTKLHLNRGAYIRFQGVISSQDDRDANFYAIMVVARAICQSATYDFVDARAIYHIAQMITRLKNNLLPGLADRLEEIAVLLEREPQTLDDMVRYMENE